MKSYRPVLLLVITVLSAMLAGCTADNPSPSPADPRETFVGNWNVIESSLKGAFECRISLVSSSSTQVSISNFANSGTPAIAEVSGTTITLLPDEIIGDGWVVNGGGALNGSNKINWTYILKAGGDQSTLTAVFTRI